MSQVYKNPHSQKQLVVSAYRGNEIKRIKKLAEEYNMYYVEQDADVVMARMTRKISTCCFDECYFKKLECQ